MIYNNSNYTLLPCSIQRAYNFTQIFKWECMIVVSELSLETLGSPTGLGSLLLPSEGITLYDPPRFQILNCEKKKLNSFVGQKY